MRNPLKQLTRAATALVALVLVVLVAAPAYAAPSLSVSQLTGLQDGQTVTISGGGFMPNMKGIAIGQCTEGYVGPADCNTATGAKFRDADANGNVAAFTIVVAEVFGAHDCTKVQCVIAAGPLPGAEDAATVKANTAVYEISFASAEAPAEPEETTSAAPTTTDDDTGTLPQTGAGDSVPVMLLAATALLAVGGGLVLLVPGRRREGLR